MKLEDIKSGDWQLAPGGGVVEGTADINQAIQLVLTTERGSDPLRPAYGISIEPIDRPAPEMRAAIIRQTIAAIEEFEPRAILETVTADIDGARITVTVRWRDARAGQSGQTTVTL